MYSEQDLSIDPHKQPAKPQVSYADNDLYEDGTVDPVYQAKARLLNTAMQEIGMGRYQVSVLHTALSPIS
jgi:hypothetical protein